MKTPYRGSLSRHKGRTFADRLIIFLVLSVLIVLFWGLFGALGYWRDINHSYEPAVRVAGLEVVRVGGEDHISARVFNPTEETLPYVRVVFGLYDQSGVFFATAVREEYSMGPGEVRSFRLWIGNGRVEKYSLLFADAWRDRSQ
ncbi:MAG: hypothetical protein JW971_07255 [Synergistales bacterium]|nr:hypothetical protein [Synergistales bacterium]